MEFNPKDVENKIKELSNDLDKGEFTTTTWLWVIGGGLIGLLASCVKLTKKNIKPVLAKFSKAGNKTEE